MLTEEQKRKKIVRPNDSMTVSLLMMDAGQRAVAPVMAGNHKPGYAVLTDEDRAKRAALYTDERKALSDRWKAPAPMIEVRSPPASTVAASYAAYDQRIVERWRAA